MANSDLQQLHWQLNPADPLAAANALIALNLLRCVRSLPGQYPGRDHDDVGHALAPVIDKLPTQLKRSLASTAAGLHAARGRPHLAASLQNEPLDVMAHAETLGEVLCNNLPAGRPAFDAAEQALVRFTAAHPPESSDNVNRLAAALSLTNPERAFLHLAAALCLGTLGRELFAFVNSPARLRRVLAQVFAAGDPGPCELPSPMLRQAGLIECRSRMGTRQDLDDLLQLTGIGERLLCTHHTSPEHMAATVLQPLAAPATDRDLEWPHLAAPLAVAKAALSGAIAHGARGFNLLLHGAPGTGKTAFVRQLVRTVGAQGYGVDHADEEGLEASRLDRLASLLLCQTFTRGRQGVVLVLDEAEDVFPWMEARSAGRRNGRAAAGKAWINQLLEQNQQPVVWISNRVDQIDPACLRRFSLCIHFPDTPYAMRRQMAEDRLAPLAVSTATIERAAANELMSPALLDSTARLVTLAGAARQCASHPSADEVVNAVIVGHATAAGHPTVRGMARPLLRFDTRFLRLSDGLRPDDVLEAMRDEGGASLLFHGPPGTGKTQFAAELAQDLGRRIVVRTASDINSPWYGQSEANVATMFAKCDPNTEVLLLDEAEVLLGARGNALQRADRAVTAEFLRWLECFEGVYICATNHPERIDAALQRRFVLRVGFQALDAAQRVDLLQTLVADQAPEPGTRPDNTFSAADLSQLQALEGLTTGDFANVARRLKRRWAGPDEWLRELMIEHRAKPAVHGPKIGFV